jgi:hypothetical protein
MNYRFGWNLCWKLQYSLTGKRAITGDFFYGIVSCKQPTYEMDLGLHFPERSSELSTKSTFAEQSESARSGSPISLIRIHEVDFL